MSKPETVTIYCDDINEKVTAILRTLDEYEIKNNLKWNRKVRYCTGQTLCKKNKNNLCPLLKDKTTPF